MGGLPGTKFLDTRRRKDPANVRALCRNLNNFEFTPYLVAPLCQPARVPGLACCTSVTPDVKAHKFLLRVRLSAALPADASTPCGCDSDSDPRFRTAKAPMGSLYKIFSALVAEVIFTSRCGDQYTRVPCRDLSMPSALGASSFVLLLSSLLRPSLSSISLRRFWCCVPIL